MFRKFLRPESGQSMVLITLVIVGMIAMLGLVMDGGNAYLQRRKMQNASDASAYAGARVLATRGNDNSVAKNCEIRRTIETYAVRNGVPGTVPTNCASLNPKIRAYFLNSSGNRVGSEIGLAVAIPTTAVGVEVISDTSFNTFFLGVMNQSSGVAQATAKVLAGSIGEPDRLQPLAVRCDQASLETCFTFGQTYDIFEGGGPGNFGWLSWNGGNNAPYVEYMLNPDSVPNPLDGYVDPRTGCADLAIGCWVQGLPGVTNASGNQNELDKWMNKKLTIVVWDTSAGSGSNTDYRVVGFATFVLTDYSLPQKRVTGRFERWVTAGEICTGSCMNTGTTGLSLRQ